MLIRVRGLRAVIRYQHEGDNRVENFLGLFVFNDREETGCLKNAGAKIKFTSLSYGCLYEFRGSLNVRWSIRFK